MLSTQWVVRWGCVVLIALATLIQMIGMGAPYWFKEQAKPAAYQAFLQVLKREGVDPGANATQPGAITRAEVHVGLWRWCVDVTVWGVFYSACKSPELGDFQGWWKGCQALSLVGTLMGVLACICAVMEVYYTRRGTRFSGLAVLCAICCFVAAVGMGLSHGLFATRYMENHLRIVHLPTLSGGTIISTFPPVLDWAFGLGAAGATLIGVTGIILVAFVTKTYPAYQRTESVVV
ncbi:uncharacterized protein [Littorina saxatilis]|uniref:Uncharacterized protein n=1 Tax=Littorina saxatilis TaxID=31220 RepID=A0AAN9BW96_9CAEN